MKHWPVPNSYSKKIPVLNTPGSFWEKREDRYHCGIDIYAPEGSEVLSVEDGKVIDIRMFTSPKEVPYWNTTYCVLIKNKSGFICKYAELGDVTVRNNEIVKSGQTIGHVGKVLDLDQIDKSSPQYIQNLKKNNYQSMLHFELYELFPNKLKNYLGGNLFVDYKPKNLLDPTDYLQSTL